jgi:hypothetical protein
MAISFPLAKAQSATMHKGPSLEKPYQEAFENPFDETKLNNLMAALPKQDTYFVIEGDLLLTEQELRAYVVEHSHGERPVYFGAELLVNVYDGQEDFYRDVAKRSLTYAVDRASFPDDGTYNTVSASMQNAAKGWEDACPECKIQFTHLADDDLHPSTDRDNFVLRYYDAHGQYIAVSFFPHDAPLRRYINIDPSYFTTTYDKVGVLRHELGHVLGYRHEHIQGIPGCYQEDNQWKPLTPYDPKSVMHYFCGGGGSMLLDLTDLDKAGHRKLYQLPPQTDNELTPVGPNAAETKKTLVVRLEGGMVSPDASAVLRILCGLGLVQVVHHKVETGEYVESIYSQQLGLPRNPSLIKLADALNNVSFENKVLHVGDDIRYPDAHFTTYPFSLKLDSSSEKQKYQLSNTQVYWSNLVRSRENLKELNSVTKVTLTGYQLLVRSNSATLLSAAAHKIAALGSYNILVVSEAQSTKANYFSLQNASEYWDRYRKAPSMVWGDEGLIGSLIKYDNPPSCAADAGGPQIVLIDTPLYHHPDIDSSIVNVDESKGSIESPPEKTENGMETQVTKLGSYKREVDHGTHIVGIISSQKNGFGFVGVQPSARIYSMDWDLLRSSTASLVALADEIERRDRQDPYSLYLFASEWPNSANMNYDLTMRLTRDVIAKKIESVGPLWIVAAGNAENSPQVDISESTPSYPMNLGDLKNVIVVTACAGCYGDTPRLMQTANYSTKSFVHIAAPGDDIPSATSGGQYDTASGTSEAVAFVAAVASSMITCSPTHYTNKPAAMKFRLQLTARPSLMAEDAKKVTGGVLDANLALRDPNKNWIKYSGAKYYSDFSPKGWCRDRLLMNGEDGGPLPEGNVKATDVFRIVKWNNLWWLYEQDPRGAPHTAEIFKIGPGSLDSPQTPLLNMGDQDPLLMNQFEDVVLSSSLPVKGPCKATH